MKVRISLAVALVALLVAGCASTGDDGFLVKNLDDVNKAIALTNQGVAAYNSYLVQQGAFDKAQAVKEYFVVALRFDPQNARAKQYLDKVEGFKTALVKDRLKTANGLLAKPKRSESEDFALVVALQTAVSVDPSNDTAAKLLKDNAAIQSTLVESFLQKSKDSQAKASDPALSDSARESANVLAYDNAAKAVAVSPSNAQAVKQKASLAGELDKAFAKRKDSAAKLVAARKFDEAKAELGRLGTLDAKLGRTHAAEIAGLTYDLYYQWAKALYAKVLYQDADDKLDTAIAAKKGDDAIALKKQIAAKLASVDQTAAFDAALPEIDRLLAKGDLVGANKRIVSATKLSSDKAKLAQLDSRRGKIADALGPIYEKGVAAYRAEDFKVAIDQLSIVVSIDSEYEQASDYLDKARDKQKLLSQYSD